MRHWKVLFAGMPDNTGGCISCTVTVNVHIESGLKGLASFAVTVTVVMPTGKVEPLAGEAITVAPGQLSDTIGIGKVTTALHDPGVFGTVIFAGQVRVGACVSCTVTVN